MSAPVPTPPAIALSRRYYGIAGGSALCALATFFVAPVIAPLGLVLAFVAVWFAIFGYLLGRDAWGNAIAAAALQALTRGRFDEVVELHARVPASSMKRGTVARAIAVQRALLALFRGSAPEAIAAIAPALAKNVRLHTKTHEHMQRASAYGVRALAHAMSGHDALAEADAVAAESAAEAMPDALARGRLARAMVLARTGDMTALAALLAKDGSLMLESTMPRERALVRALRKMARGRAKSVYREAAKPSEGGNDPGALAGWIAQVAPEAAAYAADDVIFATRSAAGAEVAGAKNVATTGAPHHGPPRLVAAAAIVTATIAVGAFLVAPALSSSEAPAPGAGGPSLITAGVPALDASLFGMALVAIFVIVLSQVLQFRRANRFNRAVIASYRAVALGDAAAAEALVAESRTSSLHLFAAAGGAMVAQVAERAADFEKCLGACDAAMARLGRRPSALAENVMPMLRELRGSALAATGRSAEAEAELAALVARHPTFSLLALADFRIRLLNAARSGDFEAARAVARTRTAELPLSLRDDLLADLVLTTAPGALSRDEMERLDAELRDSAEASKWIDAIAPGLRDELASFVHGGARLRVAESTAPSAGEQRSGDREESPVSAPVATRPSTAS